MMIMVLSTLYVDDKILDTSSCGNWSGLPAVAGL